MEVVIIVYKHTDPLVKQMEVWGRKTREGL